MISELTQRAALYRVAYNNNTRKESRTSGSKVSPYTLAYDAIHKYE
jgi:hypothetical protein